MGILMGVMGVFSTGTAKGEPPPAFFAGLGVLYVVIMPLAAFGGFFILGLLQHGLLWLWGGLRQGRGLRQTLRLHGYYLAFFLLFYMVPLLNFLILLGGPALFGIVAARVHRTDRWRAICAAYTPLLLCCGTYIAIFAIAIAMGGFK
jgi:hypothetical protein